ncbi:hypothetical protein K443DRAFT_597887 [Laccaria amethystina LaAM-08-1]|uniref:Uncharacterized protein n=1 Tax=Laccaria amethystina LaAM-08-1 TaxID=1095629 RepID=A0A0C9XXW5_9AGAR|nr:hypothetical protein K443DRAFT_597887 [Laccaria amethystina LaAM-08-1]
MFQLSIVTNFASAHNCREYPVPRKCQGPGSCPRSLLENGRLRHRCFTKLLFCWKSQALVPTQEQTRIRVIWMPRKKARAVWGGLTM